ncbi:MAG: hypothetical protein ACTTJ6_07955 [Treponema sp.]
MKKLFYIFIISIFTLIYISCNSGKNVDESKSELLILNQSSVNVKGLKYNGTFLNDGNNEDFILTAGDKGKISFEGESNGYLYFSILDAVNNREIPVRSAEVITIEKGEKRTFIITDNTSVVPIGQVISSPIIGIIRPARLKLFNKTTQNIENISFSGKTRKETLSKDDFWQVDFSQDVAGKVQFKIWNEIDKLAIEVALKDEITIKTGEIKEVTITNTSLVIKDGKTEIIRDVLGMSTLKVVNSSTAEISNLKFSDKNRNGILEKDAICEFEFSNSLEEKLEFEVQTKYKKFKVKTQENITIGQGEEKTFVITNEILVSIQDYSKPIKLSELLDVAHVIISNKCGADISATKYANVDFGIVQNSSTKEMFFLNFADVPDCVAFNIYQSSSGQTISVKTQDKFSITKGEEKTIEIVSDSVVLKEGVDAIYTIETLINAIAVLKIENKSSTSLSDVIFSGKYFGVEDSQNGYYILSINNNDQKRFQNNIEDYITFEAYSCKVHTKEKIKIEVGEIKTYTITNDTFVLLEGHSEGAKLWKLVEAARVTIINETDAELKNVSYANANFGVLPKNVGKANHVFLDFSDVSNYISFDVSSSSLVIPIKVRTNEKFVMQKGVHVEFKITNKNIVIKEGTTDEVSIRNILGISALKVINQISATKIKKLSYAGSTHKNVLEKTETWEVEFNDAKDDYLNFVIETDIDIFTVKTKEKVVIAKGEEKTVTLTNDAEVIVEGYSDATTIQKLLNAAQLTIINNTSSNLVNVKYQNINLNVLEVNHSVSVTYWNFSQLPSAISLEVQTSEGFVKLQTKELISLISGKTVTYTITKNTIVVKDGTTEQVSFKSMLGISTLKVINQTSAKEIKNLSYPNKTYNYVLPKDDSWEVEFSDVTDDYLYFVIKTDLLEFDVKTKEKVMIAKGSEKTIILTNETEVIVEGDPTPTKIISLLNAAILKIDNSTSTNLLNINYDNFNINILEANYSTSVNYWNFSQSPSAISFEVLTSNGPVKVKTQDLITLYSGETTTYKITNNTVVIKDGTGEKLSIKNVLGISTLKVINKTSAKFLRNVNYAEKKYESSLTENETWEVEFTDATDDYLEFAIVTNLTTFLVRTEEKIVIEKGEEKTITLKNYTKVVYHGHTESTKIQSLLNAAELKIFNNTSTNLLNVTYDDVNWGLLESNYNDSVFYWDFTQSPSAISFEVQTSDGVVKVHTKDVVMLISGKTIEYSITNNTIVVKAGTNEETPVRRVLGMTLLKVVNKTSSKEVSNLRYSGTMSKPKDVLAKDDSWEVEFNNAVEDFLEFTIATKFKKFDVKVREKIVITKGKEKTIVLTNDTEVIVDGDTKPTKIQNLINAAVLKITNSMVVKDVLNIVYKNISFGALTWNESSSRVLWDFDETSTAITFDVKTYSGIFTVKTKALISLINAGTTEFKITTDTLVIKEGETEAIPISQL